MLAAAILVLIAAASASTPLRAAELIMYDKAGCVWCTRWEREVGRLYERSPLAAEAPLRRMDIRDQRRSGVALGEPVYYTPTFVVADDDGVEIGRITGYRGPEAFWGELEALLAEGQR